MKPIVSTLIILASVATGFGTDEPSASSKSTPAEASASGSAEADPRLKEGASSVDDFRELARRAIQNQENGLAELYFNKALALSLPPELKRDVLIDYGKFLETVANRPSKAAAVYEQVLALFQNSDQSPDISLRLGRAYRGLGAYKSALNKFYNVLHASLRVRNGDEYQALVQSAQFEIAETHFALGEYETAGKFYSRLKLLDLPAESQAEVQFKSAYLRFLSHDYVGAAAATRDYLHDYPGTKSAPEAQYILIRSLKALNQAEDALKELVKLLRSGREHGKEHPDVWAYWQQKTGMELANELFASGDAMNALTVYQRLAELSDKPEARWPAIYQVGLCFERLRYFDRALEAYSFIAKQQKPVKPGAKDEADSNLGTLKEMATWRCDQLKWLAETDKELAVLLNRKSAAPLEGAGFMVKPDLRASEPTKAPLQAAR